MIIEQHKKLVKKLDEINTRRKYIMTWQNDIWKDTELNKLYQEADMIAGRLINLGCYLVDKSV